MAVSVQPDGTTGRGFGRDHSIGAEDPLAQRIWDQVSHSPLKSLWSFEGAPAGQVWKRTFTAFLDDNLLGRAAELGYYFLFALFPTLVSASAILGLAAKGAPQIYGRLLHYLSLVVPPSAYGIVIDTFNQTTKASTGGKVTLGLAAALWSASVGFSAMQDGMNTVYKVRETRPYWKARGSAILVTMLLSVLISLNLGVLLGGDVAAHWIHGNMNASGSAHYSSVVGTLVAIHAVQWVLAAVLLVVQFSVIYYYAPDLKNKCWHWLTPGAVIGLLGWVVASLGLKAYLHFFNSYSVTYGSLGAVIVLLTWFYITGVMLLLGAEINSQIQAAVMEQRLRETGEIDGRVRVADTTPQ